MISKRDVKKYIEKYPDKSPYLYTENEDALYDKETGEYVVSLDRFLDLYRRKSGESFESVYYDHIGQNDNLKEYIQEELINCIFRLEVDTGIGGYGLDDTIDELLYDVEREYGKELREEVRKWALQSNIGDQFIKHGVYITNIGR